MLTWIRRKSDRVRSRGPFRAADEPSVHSGAHPGTLQVQERGRGHVLRPGVRHRRPARCTSHNVVHGRGLVSFFGLLLHVVSPLSPLGVRVEDGGDRGRGADLVLVYTNPKVRRDLEADLQEFRTDNQGPETQETAIERSAPISDNADGRVWNEGSQWTIDKTWRPDVGIRIQPTPRLCI